MPLVGLVSVLAIGGMKFCGKSEGPKNRQESIEHSEHRARRRLYRFHPRRAKQTRHPQFEAVEEERVAVKRPIERALPPGSLDCDMRQVSSLSLEEERGYILPWFSLVCDPSNSSFTECMLLPGRAVGLGDDTAALASIVWHLNSLGVTLPGQRFRYDEYKEERRKARAEGLELWIDPKCLARNKLARELLFVAYEMLASSLYDIKNLKRVLSGLPEGHRPVFIKHNLEYFGFAGLDDAEVETFLDSLPEEQRNAFLPETHDATGFE